MPPGSPGDNSNGVLAGLSWLTARGLIHFKDMGCRGARKSRTSYWNPLEFCQTRASIRAEPKPARRGGSS